MTEKPKIEKILIVDDDNERVWQAGRLFGKERIVDSGITAMYNSYDTRDKNLRDSLERERYGAILMDGNIGKISEDYPTGKSISRRIREGVYGETNRHTPIVNISLDHTNEFAFYCLRNLRATQEDIEIIETHIAESAKCREE